MIHFSMPVSTGTGGSIPVFPTGPTGSGHLGDGHACGHLPHPTRLRANGVVCVMVIVVLVVLQQNLGMDPLAALGLLLSAGWATSTLLPGLLGVSHTPTPAQAGATPRWRGPSSWTSPSQRTRRGRHRGTSRTALHASRRITRG